MSAKTRRNEISQYLVDDADIADRFRYEQLEAIIRLTPSMMFIHSLVGVFIVWFFYQTASPMIIWGWAGLLFFVVLNNLDTWRRHRKGLIDHDPEAINRVVVVNAMALSLCWGIATVLLFPNADLKQQLALACVMISMMGIGAFSLASIRQAALVYISVFTIFTVLSLLMAKDDLFIALTGLQGIWALAVAVAVMHHSFLFAERMVTQSMLNRRSAMIGVLEKDLNEGLNIRRVEMTPDGVIMNIDNKLARDLSYSLAELSNTQFLDLLTHVQSLEKIDGYYKPAAFEVLLEKKQNFDEKLICAQGKDGPSFWWVSGRYVSHKSEKEEGYRIFLRPLKPSYLHALGTTVSTSKIGLPDQKALEKKIYGLLSQNLKKNVPFSSILVEIRNLAELSSKYEDINEQQVIQATGNRLKAVLSGKGYVAYYDREKFCILVPAKYNPEKLMKNLCFLLEKGVHIGGNSVGVELAMGAVICPKQAHTVQDIFSNCDEVLKNGRLTGSRTTMFQDSTALGERQMA